MKNFLILVLILCSYSLGAQSINSNKFIDYQGTMSTKWGYYPMEFPFFLYSLATYDNYSIIYNPKKSINNKLHFQIINLESKIAKEFSIPINPKKFNIEFQGLDFLAMNNQFLAFQLPKINACFIYNYKQNKIIKILYDSSQCLYKNCKLSDNYLLLYRTLQSPSDICNVSVKYKLIDLRSFLTIKTNTIENSFLENIGSFKDLELMDVNNKGDILVSNCYTSNLIIQNNTLGKAIPYDVYKDSTWLDFNISSLEEFNKSYDPEYPKSKIEFLRPIFDSTSRIEKVKFINDSIIFVRKIPKYSSKNNYYIHNDLYKISNEKLESLKIQYLTQELNVNEKITESNINVDAWSSKKAVGNNYIVTLYPHADINIIGSTLDKIEKKLSKLKSSEYRLYLNVFKFK